MKDKIRVPVKIKIRPYLMDHQFKGEAVLPAVEAMQLLAGSTQTFIHDINTRFIGKAKFNKFLYVKPEYMNIENFWINAFNEIKFLENDNIGSKLITIIRSKKGSITRAKEHVSIVFTRKNHKFPKPPTDLVSPLKGDCFNIPSNSLYADLVPFGPAYRNLKGTLLVSENGALANIYGSANDAPSNPLGSPFPLDAAFHAACAWGQRFSKIVAFPVGFEKRFIFRLTNFKKKYICKIIPIQTYPGLLIFDIWIYDSKGALYEAVLGMHMKDISGGRLKPPQWVMEKHQDAVRK